MRRAIISAGAIAAISLVLSNAAAAGNETGAISSGWFAYSDGIVGGREAAWKTRSSAACWMSMDVSGRLRTSMDGPPGRVR